MLEGFGGVSEYGITVRWDKNFLTLIHLTLARRDKLRIYGGVRFGGALPMDEAWAMGIDHIAIAAGAGRPTIIDIKNNLIRGIRKASDFLMALQLTGAFKRDALSNLQARLPAVVIGGGLTGVDTATELMAYYPIQVEKILERYDALVRDLGEARVRGMMDAEELGILDEFRSHGVAVKAERARAAAAGEKPNFIDMIRGWGGVTLAYRKRLQDAPAYRLNHEEVTKALEEGISVTENMNPVEAVPDEYGHVTAMVFTRADGSSIELPARTVLVAAGTSPNVTYEKEHPGSFALDNKQKFFKGFKAGEERTRHTQLAAGSERFLHLARHRWQVRELLRRQPPALQRQRGEGDGVGEAWLPARRRVVRRSHRGAQSGRAAATRARLGHAGRGARRPAARARRARGAADADDRRGDRSRARGGAALPSRAVLPVAELRAPESSRAPRRSRRVAADGRDRAHRRVGRRASRACCR